jgi:hypothetical protein
VKFRVYLVVRERQTSFIYLLFTLDVIKIYLGFKSDIFTVQFVSTLFLDP